MVDIIDGLMRKLRLTIPSKPRKSRDWAKLQGDLSVCGTAVWSPLCLASENIVGGGLGSRYWLSDFFIVTVI
jgi:hypothetical protein